MPAKKTTTVSAKSSKTTASAKTAKPSAKSTASAKTVKKDEDVNPPVAAPAKLVAKGRKKKVEEAKPAVVEEPVAAVVEQKEETKPAKKVAAKKTKKEDDVKPPVPAPAKPASARGRKKKVEEPKPEVKEEAKVESAEVVEEKPAKKAAAAASKRTSYATSIFLQPAITTTGLVVTKEPTAASKKIVASKKTKKVETEETKKVEDVVVEPKPIEEKKAEPLRKITSFPDIRYDLSLEDVFKIVLETRGIDFEFLVDVLQRRLADKAIPARDEAKVEETIVEADKKQRQSLHFDKDLGVYVDNRAFVYEQQSDSVIAKVKDGVVTSLTSEDVKELGDVPLYHILKKQESPLTTKELRVVLNLPPLKKTVVAKTEETKVAIPAEETNVVPTLTEATKVAPSVAMTEGWDDGTETVVEPPQTVTEPKDVVQEVEKQLSKIGTQPVDISEDTYKKFVLAQRAAPSDKKVNIQELARISGLKHDVVKQIMAQIKMLRDKYPQVGTVGVQKKPVQPRLFGGKM